MRLRFLVFVLDAAVYPKIVSEGEQFLEPPGAQVIIDIEKCGEPRNLVAELVAWAINKAKLLGLSEANVKIVEATA